MKASMGIPCRHTEDLCRGCRATEEARHACRRTFVGHDIVHSRQADTSLMPPAAHVCSNVSNCTCLHASHSRAAYTLEAAGCAAARRHAVHCLPHIESLTCCFPTALATEPAGRSCYKRQSTTHDDLQ